MRRAGACAWLAVLLLAAPLTGSGDGLSRLPEDRQAQLQPVPEVDISGVEARVRDAIRQRRGQIATALRAGDADPRLAAGYGELAALYQLVDIETAAAAAWENAARLEPGAFRWQYYAGYHALITGHPDRAQARLQRAREIDPDYAPLYLRFGQLWLDTGQLDRAETALEQAAEHAGLRAAALYHQGQLALLRRDYPSAVDHLTEVLRLDPQAGQAHYPLAQAYRQLGRTEQAREHLAEFERRMPAVDDRLVTELEAVLQTSRGLFSRAMQAIDAYDYAGAIDLFRQGLEIEPDNPDARTSYARVLYLDGRQAGAIDQLQAVIDAQPGHSLANFLLGVVLQSQGNLDAAMQRYRRVIELDPQEQGAHYQLANALYEAGRFREAAAQYRAALEADAEIPPARWLELVARRRAGAPDSELAAALRSRIRLYPAQEELKYALVRLLLLSDTAEVRDPDAALEMASALVEQRATPPHLAVLALARAAQGQYGQAAELQSRVVEMMGGMMADAALREQLVAARAAYEDDRLPDEAIWPATDPLFRPVPLNPGVIFVNYPAPVSY